MAWRGSGVRIPLAPQTTRIAYRDAGFSFFLALQAPLHEASVSFPLTRVGAGVEAAPNDSRSRGARYLRVRVRLCGRTVGFPDSCPFSQIRRGSLREFGAVAIDLPTGTPEFRRCEKSSPKPFSGERRRNRPFPVNSHETMGLSPPMAGVWVTSHTLTLEIHRRRRSACAVSRSDTKTRRIGNSVRTWVLCSSCRKGDMNPSHPTIAPVAQWIRAADYGSAGCRFESCLAHHQTLGPLQRFEGF